MIQSFSRNFKLGSATHENNFKLLKLFHSIIEFIEFAIKSIWTRGLGLKLVFSLVSCFKINRQTDIYIPENLLFRYLDKKLFHGYQLMTEISYSLYSVQYNIRKTTCALVLKSETKYGVPYRVSSLFQSDN